ncbi:MAG: carbon storage regulator [Planctomycetota bacterium]
MHVFERQEDQWLLIGRDYAIGPTDIDADAGIVRFIANGRRIGGPEDGEAFTDSHEVARGQTVELGPNILLNVLEVRPGSVRVSIHAPKHMTVLTREDAERLWGRP